MATLERRVQNLESIQPSCLCYHCSLLRLMGDESLGENCPHPERVTYEEVLRELQRSTG